MRICWHIEDDGYDYVFFVEAEYTILKGCILLLDAFENYSENWQDDPEKCEVYAALEWAEKVAQKLAAPLHKPNAPMWGGGTISGALECMHGVVSGKESA